MVISTSRELFCKLNLKVFVIKLATRLLGKSIQRVCIHDCIVNKVKKILVSTISQCGGYTRSRTAVGLTYQHHPCKCRVAPP